MKNLILNLERSKYWEQVQLPKSYIRNRYLDFLLKLSSNNRLIKVLTGQRRVGKSFILKQFMASLIQEHNVCPRNIFYLNFESEDFAVIKSKEDLSQAVQCYLSQIKPNLDKEVYLICDEIQDIMSWERLLASYIADSRIKYQIFITGSNSNLLSSELATYITGRYIAKEVLPFSYEEYLGYHGLEYQQENLLKYLSASSLPETFVLANEEIVRSYLKAVKDSILLKDIVKRYKVENVTLLENLFLFLLDNLSNLFSINSIVKKLDSINISTNTNTIGNYIRYLEEAYVLQGISRFDLKGRKILEGEKKYYINDLGLRKFLFSQYDLASGKFLENFVYNNLKYYGYQVYTGKVDDFEIDFIAEKNSKRIYIQVAYLLSDTKVVEREFGNLERIRDNYPKVVISLDPVSMGTRNGIEHKLAWESPIGYLQL